jgi:hypothetical protein
MSATRERIDEYFTMWNEDDAERRNSIAARCFVDTATYVDPVADVAGPSAISAMVGELRATHPGFALRLNSAIDEHHDRVRFEWQILDADGGVFLTGVDCAVVAPDGRLVAITGFFGANPEKLAA